jgi:hypothetical protein
MRSIVFEGDTWERYEENIFVMAIGGHYDD